MNWRRRMFAAVAAVVGVAIVSWLGWNFYQRHAEPVYEGRRLSEWLVAFEPRNVMWGNTVVSRDRWSRSVTERDARRAVHELGTNCLPVLLKMLLATDPPLKTKLLGLLAKQHYWRPHITTANDLHTEAQQAFYILGAQAESAVPELTRMLNENPSSDTRYMVAWVLNYVGPAADSAIPALEKASRSTDVSLAQTASNALRNLRPTDLNLLPDSLRHPKLDPAKLADANSV